MLDFTSRKEGAVAASSAPSAVLTAQEMAAYGERGWLLARGFVAPAEVEALARWTDEVAAGPEEPGKHMVYREPSLKCAGRRVI